LYKYTHCPVFNPWDLSLARNTPDPLLSSWISTHNNYNFREIVTMSGIISKISIASFFISSLAIFGCSSSDDGGGVAVPPNAITITEANAKNVVSQASLGGSALIDLIPVAANVEQAPSAKDIIELAVDQVKKVRLSPVLNIPVGEVIEIPCDSGTSITVNGTETATSASGTMTFNDCILGSITLSGTISFSVNFNDTTGDWTVTITGNISGTDSTFTTTLSGLALNQTGNDLTYEFSINTYTFAIDYTGGGGFLVQLLAAIKGNEMETCPISPRSGIILVTGTGSTRAKGTINSNGTVTIEHDDGSGTFTEVTEPAPGSPYPCSDFFV